MEDEQPPLFPFQTSDEPIVFIDSAQPSKLPPVKSVPPVTASTGTVEPVKRSAASAPTGLKKETNVTPTLLSLQTVSLKKKPEELVQKSSEEEEETLLLNQPFTSDALLRSWNNFIETIQNDIHLVNAMKSCTPVLKDDYVVEVTVQNQPLEKKFQDLLIPLERHLHHHLKNNRIKMSVRLAEGGEMARPFTSRDKLDAMIQKNPNMELLYRTFGLDIN